MADDTVVSSPEAGQAGDKHTEGPGRGLAAALNSAFEEVGLGEGDEPSGKEPEVEQPEAKAPEAKEPQPGKQEEPREAPTAPRTAAPTHWDAAARAKFDGLPDTAKSIVLDLAKWQERDYTRKTTELANVRRYAEAVSSLVTDEHREQLRQAGLDEVQGFERLLQYQDYALRQPKNYVRWFMQAANLGVTDVFPEIAGARPAATQPQPGRQPQPQPTNGAGDPQFTQLRETVNYIANGWNDFQRQRAEEQRQHREEAEEGAAGMIHEFRTEVDDQGQAKRPFFAQVEDDMTQILLSNAKIAAIRDPRMRLQKAYDAAVAMDDDLRQQAINLAAVQKQDASRRASDVQKAQKAKAPVSAQPTTDPEARGKLKLGDHVARSMVDLGVS